MRTAEESARSINELFLLQAAMKGRRDVKLGPLASLLKRRAVRSSETELNGRDHVLLVPKGQDLTALEAEIHEALRSARPKGTEALTIVLDETQAAHRTTLQQTFGDVRFLGHSDLATPAQVEAFLLQPILADAGGLTLLLYNDGSLSLPFTEILVQLSRSDRYRDRVQFIVLTLLSSTALAIRASMADFDAMLSFHALVLSQA
jgi:hypothetical protein